MVIRETELKDRDPGGELLRSEWAEAEIDQEVASYEKALGICHNLMLYSTGEKEDFRAYFVKSVPEQAAIERHIRRTLNLSGDLPVSETPQSVLKIDNIDLYRWSGVLNGSEFDIFYEACRDGEMPIYFQQSQMTTAVTESPTEAAEA